MRKYLHFEGLRGVAALVVFISHFRPTFCTNINGNFLDYLGITSLKLRALIENFISLVYEGTLPVYIFWFMSAYVISIKLFDTTRNANNMYLIEASSKRYFRLGIPVFFASLLCFFLLKYHAIYNSQLAEYLGKGYADGWLNKWYHFEPGIVHFLKTTIVEVFMPGNNNYDIALWTMNPELFGSFLCFGLFAVIGKNKRRFIIYLSSLFFLTIAGLRDTTCFYYLVFVSGLMWSDLTYSTDQGVWMKDKIKKIVDTKQLPLVLLFIGFGGMIFSDTIYPVHEKLYYFFSFPVKAVGLTLLVNNFNLIKRLFSTKLFVFMGKISFSFYLIHLPLMFSLGIYMYLYAGIQSPHKLIIIFAVLLVVNILLAYLFMKYIDKKAIALSDKIGKYFSSGQ